MYLIIMTSFKAVRVAGRRGNVLKAPPGGKLLPIGDIR